MSVFSIWLRLSWQSWAIQAPWTTASTKISPANFLETKHTCYSWLIRSSKTALYNSTCFRMIRLVNLLRNSSLILKTRKFNERAHISLISSKKPTSKQSKQPETSKMGDTMPTVQLATQVPWAAITKIHQWAEMLSDCCTRPNRISWQSTTYALVPFTSQIRTDQAAQEQSRAV